MAGDSELTKFRDFLNEELPMNMSTAELRNISARLTESFLKGMKDSEEAMLPSHIYHLPSGYEKGIFLAVDLGGSTLRVAMVKLEGHKDDVRRGSVVSSKHPRPMWITQMKSWGGADIDHLKTLTGDAFFDWIADKVAEVIVARYGKTDTEELQLGLSWSFPIQNTSIDTGKVQAMGKGFRVADGLIGTDLKTHLTNAFSRKNLNITLQAIVNDSLAALLSHAYVAPATRCALILGTGTNAAVSLPLGMLPDSKLVPSHSSRPSSAQEVLVNTELSMFGRDIFPITRFDEDLDSSQDRPGFQPLEYLIGGGYLGDVARRLIIDGARQFGLFTNVLPSAWTKDNSISSEMLAIFECLEREDIPSLYSEIDESLPGLKLCQEDAEALIHIARHVSSRAAVYCAIALHAMIKLREHSVPSPSAEASRQIIPIAFVGSVMEKYPRLQERTQAALDRLTGWTDGYDPNIQRMLLEFSPESAIFGAAVAVAAAIEKSSSTVPSAIVSDQHSGTPTLMSPALVPLSQPHTERSSNASTLISRATGSEEENKSNSGESGMSKRIGDSVPLPLEDRALQSDKDIEKQADGKRLNLWSRFAVFCRNIFNKVFKRKQGEDGETAES